MTESLKVVELSLFSFNSEHSKRESVLHILYLDAISILGK